MARLQSRTGTVHQVERRSTPWRGEHGERITVVELGGMTVSYPGTPSVGAGDVVTVVGIVTGDRMLAKAFRNESTDVSYGPTKWPGAVVGFAMLGVLAPWVGFPGAFVLVPLGALALMHALLAHRVRWMLDQQPSHHRAPIRVPHHPTGHAPQT